MTEFILICIIAHVLGDFYLQTDHMAESKRKDWRKLLLHGAVYGIPFLLPFVFLRYSFDLLLSVGLMILSHLLLDLLKFILTLSLRRGSGRWSMIRSKGFLYVVDQLLHLTAILLLSNLLTGTDIGFYGWLEQLAGRMPFTAVQLIRWSLLLLVIYRPVNITIHQLFSDFKPVTRKELMGKDMPKLMAATLRVEEVSNEAEEVEYVVDKLVKDKKAGAIIGFLERLIIVIFVSLQQYAAIGLVLTAKSIVRYDRIAKDQEFSEYYLIGTLFSLISALVLYYAVFLEL